MSYRMNDKEVLLLAYGAMKACEQDEPKLAAAIEIVEEHLFPAAVVAAEKPAINLEGMHQ